MNQFEQFRAKWNDFYEKMKPGMDKTGVRNVGRFPWN